MARVYIDTNVFLDFYQAGTDRLDAFRELVTRADKILLTEQTIQEFRRNREGRLSELVSAIRKSSAVPLPTTAVVRDLEEFSAWQTSRDETQRAAHAVAAALEKWIAQEESDRVLAEFEKLVTLATTLPITEGAISLAQRRKLLGNPPSSPDKHTIGDELIWEILLAQAEEDLIVVSRDKTFLKNEGFLRREYEKQNSRKLVLVTKHLREALSSLGAPSKTIEKVEAVIEATRSEEGIFQPDLNERNVSSAFARAAERQARRWLSDNYRGWTVQSHGPTYHVVGDGVSTIGIELELFRRFSMDRLQLLTDRSLEILRRQDSDLDAIILLLIGVHDTVAGELRSGIERLKLAVDAGVTIVIGHMRGPGDVVVDAPASVLPGQDRPSA